MPDLLDGLKDLLREVVREELRAVLQEPKPATLLLDTKAAAQLLQVPASWVATAARRGELPSIRCGHHVRFAVSELEKFIEEKKLGASPRQSEATRGLKGDPTDGKRIAGAG